MNKYTTSMEEDDKEKRSIIFSKELGLAIEKPQNNMTVN